MGQAGVTDWEGFRRGKIFNRLEARGSTVGEQIEPLVSQAVRVREERRWYLVAGGEEASVVEKRARESEELANTSATFARLLLLEFPCG